MRFSFDPAAPSGQRVRSLAVLDGSGNVSDRVVAGGKLMGDPERVFKVVTLNFLANGGDGYLFPVPHPGRIDFSGEAGQYNPHYADFPTLTATALSTGRWPPPTLGWPTLSLPVRNRMPLPNTWRTTMRRHPSTSRKQNHWMTSASRTSASQAKPIRFSGSWSRMFHQTPETGRWRYISLAGASSGVGSGCARNRLLTGSEI